MSSARGLTCAAPALRRIVRPHAPRTAHLSAALGLATLIGAAPSRAVAQAPRPRSLDYLMLAGVDDVRATWLNPAGLARVLEASIMGEVVVDREPDGTLHLGQYTLGLNSRGVSFAYLRDRVPGTRSVGIFRFGLATSFRRGAVGLGVSLYQGGRDDEGLDLGVRYRPFSQLDLGLAVRNVSRPVVRNARLPVTAAFGTAWTPLAGRLQLAAETEMIERLAASGFDWRYRGVLQFGAGRPRLGGILAVDFDSRGDPTRWTLGVQIGASDLAGLLGSATPVDDLGRVDRMSVMGVSSRRGDQFQR